MQPPNDTFHSSFPSRASKAWKYPARLPVNTTSPAVVSTPPSVRSANFACHTVSPVFGLRTFSAPYPCASFGSSVVFRP
jgi:hypothetical protein